MTNETVGIVVELLGVWLLLLLILWALVEFTYYMIDRSMDWCQVTGIWLAFLKAHWKAKK